MDALKLYHALSAAMPIEDPDVIMINNVEAFNGCYLPKVFHHVLLNKRGNLADVGGRNTFCPAFDLWRWNGVVRNFNATEKAQCQ